MPARSLALTGRALGEGVLRRCGGPSGARRHRVEALVWRLAPGALDARAAGAFRSAFARTLAENMGHLEWTRRALEVLGEAGAEPMPLKGALFAARWYPHLGTRPQTDVDVLVSPERLEAAHAALLRAGWTEAAPRAFYADHYHWVYAREDGPLLELHWRLKYPGTCQPDVRAFRARAKQASAEGVRFLEPAPEDLLEYLAVNKAMQHFPNLLGFLDLHFVAQSARIDWERTARSCEGNGTCGPMWFGLSHCREFFGTEVPERVLERLARSARGARALARILRRWGGPLGAPVDLLDGPVGRMYEAFFEPSVRMAWSIWRPLLLPSRARVEAVAGGSYLRYLRQHASRLGEQTAAARRG
ncbi:MAG: nucleotidyltransferase family protein [Elusimicrobia bacterium]|nr:nucleotidyltransferase family protein [Elusimicrobiota bacterium]